MSTRRKRFRRFTMTVDGGAIAGARDFRYDDNSEYNRDKSDDEAVGDQVRMSEGPFSISFEMLQADAAIVSGFVATLVVVGKEVTRAAGDESTADRTYTFEQGNFNAGGDHPTDNPGRLPVTGEFKTLVIS